MLTNRIDTLACCNPQIYRMDSLARFEKMSFDEFLKELNDTLESAKKIRAGDDSGYVKKLDETDAQEYASHCQIFLGHVQSLEKIVDRLSPNSGLISIAQQYLASVIAWRQVISTFKTLHG